MQQDVMAELTSKDDKYAWEISERIIVESQESDVWYGYFDDFATLLNHSSSLVRNRVLYILAANAQWDVENRFDAILSNFLTHITDEKPITSRQCIKALIQVGKAKPQYISTILSAFHSADLSKYKESMCSLIKKDITAAEETLSALISKE